MAENTVTFSPRQRGFNTFAETPNNNNNNNNNVSVNNASTTEFNNSSNSNGGGSDVVGVAQMTERMRKLTQLFLQSENAGSSAANHHLSEYNNNNNTNNASNATNADAANTDNNNSNNSNNNNNNYNNGPSFTSAALTLEERDTIRQIFSSVVKEGESIQHVFDLRVALGEVGLYPAEEELRLVVAANGGRVSFSGLCRYLLFYKREYEMALLYEKTQEERAAKNKDNNNNNNNNINNSGINNRAPQSAQEAMQQQVLAAFSFTPGGNNNHHGNNTNYNNLGALSPAGRVHVMRGMGSEGADTLAAFVALGGGADGSGEIPSEAVSSIIHQFNLTVDLANILRAIDMHNAGVLDYEDFCQVVYGDVVPLGSHGSNNNNGDNNNNNNNNNARTRQSVGSFSALDAVSPSHYYDFSPNGTLGNNNNNPNMINGIDLSQVPESHRQILATLAGGRRESSLWKTIRQSRASLAAQGRLTSAAGAPSSVNNPAANASVLQQQQLQQQLQLQQQRQRQAELAAGKLLPNPLLSQPISEDEHKVLLYYYLFPEEYIKQVAAINSAKDSARRAKFAANLSGGNFNNNSSNNNSNMNSARRRSTQLNTSGDGLNNNNNNNNRSVSITGGGGATYASAFGKSKSRSLSGKNNSTTKKRRGVSSQFDDEDEESDYNNNNNNGGDGYRPPSPMNLAQRNNTRYRNENKKMRELLTSSKTGALQQEMLRTVAAQTQSRNNNNNNNNMNAGNNNNKYAATTRQIGYDNDSADDNKIATTAW